VPRVRGTTTSDTRGSFNRRVTRVLHVLELPNHGQPGELTRMRRARSMRIARPRWAKVREVFPYIGAKSTYKDACVAFADIFRKGACAFFSDTPAGGGAHPSLWVRPAEVDERSRRPEEVRYVSREVQGGPAPAC
jgi:hypothetical protein